MSYQPVQPSDDAESCSSGERSSVDMRDLEKYRKPVNRLHWKWLPVLLSGLLNIVLAILLVLSRVNHESINHESVNHESVNHESGTSVSKYAGLPSISLPWLESSEFSSENLDLANELWEKIDFDPGVIALDEDFIKSKGLPAAQPHPWDVSKSLYLINGYHNLHCAKSIHASLMQFHWDEPQTFPFEHIMHCVDALRLEIICQADDTPRYSTADNKLGSGIGQYRQCKDWSKLESWAQDNSACFRYFNYSANSMFDQRERFVFCPPESPYIPRVEKYLKYKEAKEGL